MFNLKNKKNIIIILLLIIIAILLSIIIIPKIVDSKPNILTENTEVFQNVEKKDFKIGDNLNAKDIETYFKKIYENYTMSALNILGTSKNAKYPYISKASIGDEGNIYIHYDSDTILIDEMYDKNKGELSTMLVTLINPNNKKIFELIVSMSTDINLIYDDTGNIDTSISNGLQSAFTDDSDKFKVVYDKYKDPVWTIKRTSSMSDETGEKIVTFYANREQ